MDGAPLAELIAGRGFDRFQSGLTSRFAAYKLGYRLTYCPATNDPAMTLDFESPLHLGRVTVWSSGHCHLEVLELESGRVVLQEYRELQSEREFHDFYPQLMMLMRDALGFPRNAG